MNIFPVLTFLWGKNVSCLPCTFYELNKMELVNHMNFCETACSLPLENWKLLSCLPEVFIF